VQQLFRTALSVVSALARSARVSRCGRKCRQNDGVEANAACCWCSIYRGEGRKPLWVAITAAVSSAAAASFRMCEARLASLRACSILPCSRAATAFANKWVPRSRILSATLSIRHPLMMWMPNADGAKWFPLRSRSPTSGTSTPRRARKSPGSAGAKSEEPRVVAKAKLRARHQCTRLP
jgi:hypothetical protein